MAAPGGATVPLHDGSEYARGLGEGGGGLTNRVQRAEKPEQRAVR